MNDPRVDGGTGPRPPGHQRRLFLLALVTLVLVVGALALAPSRGDDADATRVDLRAGSTTAAKPAGTSAGRPTTTSTTAATTTAVPAGPEHISLAFAGDLLPHLPLDAQAARYGTDSGARYDFGPMLAPMYPVISNADIAICHMETPVAPDQDRITGYPAFGAPAELVDAVADVGYDGCSTASNHSLDQGRTGIAATLDRFDQRGLRHAGTARTAEEGATITTYEVKGATVAHLSYAYDFNGYKIPGDAPFAVNQIQADRIRADAHRAREAGAQLVVVSLHWGTEYQHEPSQYQRDVAALVLPSPDIDVIIGHHAHVVQPIEQVAGTYVVWGLGNQLANQPEVPRSDGLTVKLDARRQADGRYRVAGIEAIPTFVEAGGSYRVWPIVAALRTGQAPASLRGTLRESYDRTVAVVRSGNAPAVTIADLPA